jgi:hypothetical protein
LNLNDVKKKPSPRCDEKKLEKWYINFTCETFAPKIEKYGIIDKISKQLGKKAARGG